MRRVARLSIILSLVTGLLALNGAPLAASGEPPIPLGLPADTWRYWVPADNPLTAEKIALGRRLFFDPRLSVDGTISCASCHKPELGFADGRAVAEGVRGQRGTRNAMSLLNVIYNTAQFWVFGATAC